MASPFRDLPVWAKNDRKVGTGRRPRLVAADGRQQLSGSGRILKGGTPAATIDLLAKQGNSRELREATRMIRATGTKSAKAKNGQALQTRRTPDTDLISKDETLMR